MRTPITRRQILKTGTALSLGALISQTIGANVLAQTSAKAATPRSRSGTDPRTIIFENTDALAKYTRLSALQEAQPLLMAHRAGYSPQGIYPESALESARHVLETGPAMIEIDLRTTSDGEIVCVHDDTLDRETTGQGLIEETNYATIAKLNLKDFTGKVTDFKVRTFDEFLDWGRVGAFLWLDIKTAEPEVVVRKIREHGAEARVVVSAYGLENVRAYRELAPELVYFIPVIPDLDLPDVDTILSNVADPARIIGFAGWNIPNLDQSVQLRDNDIPALLDLSRADQRLTPDVLDDTLYTTAVVEGFPMMNTDQYARVLEILEIRDWA